MRPILTALIIAACGAQLPDSEATREVQRVTHTSGYVLADGGVVLPDDRCDCTMLGLHISDASDGGIYLTCTRITPIACAWMPPR